jgi:hypothetical protein
MEKVIEAMRLLKEAREELGETGFMLDYDVNISITEVSHRFQKYKERIEARKKAEG